MSLNNPYLQSLRLNHWFKNLLLIPGLAFAYLLDNPFSLKNTLLALLTTCLAASANYLINEYLDRHSDAHHPQKSSRPAPNALLKLPIVLILYFLLANTSILLAFLINNQFTITLTIFLILAIFYNVPPLRLKTTHT